MEIRNVQEKNGELSFDIINVLLPYVNGIRRTILSDIDVVGIKGFPHDDCDIKIHENNTNLNNEIIKHRLSCIPIHLFRPTNTQWKKLKVVLNIKNETEQIIPVTTENFSIVDINSGNKLSDEITKKIFPPDNITGEYILIAYLNPVSDKMKKPNHLYFESTFSLVNPRINSVYNCVSKINFSNIIDIEKQEIAWREYQKTIKDPEIDMEKEKQNWKALKGQHYFSENAFNFKIKSIGFYKNSKILLDACDIITNKLIDISNKKNIRIESSKKTVIENSFDIILENESYTIGNILKKSIYDLFYNKDVTYVGFVVEHPHDSHSILRLSYNLMVDIEYIHNTLDKACEESVKFLDNIKKLISENM